MRDDGGVGAAFEVFVGTEDGVIAVGDGVLDLGLDGHRVSALYAYREGERSNPTLLAGTYEAGLRRSEDWGETWQEVEGMTAPCVRMLTPDPLVAGALLCGTEPARLFRSTDHGLTWSEVPGISSLPEQERWYLPYSPRSGALRNVDLVPGDVGHLVAAVEVGGLLRTTDGGKTWVVEAVVGNDDIHQVVGDPAESGRLWASLGYAALRHRDRGPNAPPLGGVARSDDGGLHWKGLHTDYTRSTIPVPAVPGLVLSGPAPRVGEAGRIVTSADSGESWQEASNGIETPMPDMVELFQPAPDGSIFAVCSGGRLLRADPDRWQWASALPPDRTARVSSVAFLPR